MAFKSLIGRNVRMEYKVVEIKKKFLVNISRKYLITAGPISRVT